MRDAVGQAYRRLPGDDRVKGAGVKVRAFRTGMALILVIQIQNLLLGRAITPVGQPGLASPCNRYLKLLAEGNVPVMHIKKAFGDLIGKVRGAEQDGLRAVL